MRQANAEIGVAFAGYFPGRFARRACLAIRAIRSNASFGPTNPVWSFGASLAQPLFNGGLTTAAGRGCAPDLRGGRRDLSPDRADRDPAGRGQPCRDSHPVAARSRCRRRMFASRGRRRRSRSTNIGRARRRSPRLSPPRPSSSRRRKTLLATQAQLQADAVEPHRRARRRLDPDEAAGRRCGDARTCPPH